MHRRIYSLETEYALAFEPMFKSRGNMIARDKLYEMIESEILQRHAHAACDPTGRSAYRDESSLIEICEGFFLANGARLYYDTGHLEWAAPETTDPYQALLYDRAGEMEIAAAAEAVENKIKNGRPLIVKNNLDYRSGVTYGCHENYSIRPRSNNGQDVRKQIIEQLIPFLVTRQILCGSGRIDADRPPYVSFQLSQRADFITSISSVETRENRPIVNLRDEPLADPHSHARLHLILGDSNMAEYSTFLKLGTTGILLDMIEDNAPLPHIILNNPRQSLRKISRDLEFSHRLPLRGGGSETAIGIQRAYWQAARAFSAKKYPDDRQARQITRLWEQFLEDIEQRSPQLDTKIDWAIKRKMFNEFLQEMGVTWEELDLWVPILARTWNINLPQSLQAEVVTSHLREYLGGSDWKEIENHCRQYKLRWINYNRFRGIAAALRTLDIRYHDINPRRGLFYQWGKAHQVLDDDSQLKAALGKAPQNTRARPRALALKLAHKYNKKIHMDWHYISIDTPGDEISLPDPFDNKTSRIRQAFEHPDLTPEEEIRIKILGVENMNNPEEVN